MSVFTYIDLVTEKGELVRIECPSKHEDELYDSICNAMKRGDWWSVNQFEGCRAEFMGRPMDRIAMNKIMGML